MEKLFPDFQVELENWSTDFQLLICIILSAQTTDRQVNTVTEGLFTKFPDAQSMKDGDVSELAELIGSVNYRNSKAKYIKKTANILFEKYGGDVPREVDLLTELAGVGLKTAHVYLNVRFKDNQGIGADTHIIRTSNRLGLSKEKDPEKVALDLQNIYPREQWFMVNSLFVLYGRYYCTARVKPAESKCVFKEEGMCSWCSEAA